jgi:hypothetical protein
MLYTYKSVPSDFDKLHRYIEHTVLEVWCKPIGTFSIGKLHPDFQPMVQAVKKNKNDYLYKPIRLIYNRFLKLEPTERRKLKQGFKINNAVSDLCNGKGKPLLYEEIKNIDETLHDYLQSFGKNLYSEVPKLKSCIDYAGKLDKHYDDFVANNKAELCPFCGLLDVKSQRLSVRDAFDHFLSKDVYPFISVNTANLAPMCYDCNSGYKLQQDPICNNDGRRTKTFYPLSGEKTGIKILIEINTTNIKAIQPSEIKIGFSSNKKNQQAKRWAELFGLEERYKDKCCKDKDGKYWFRQVTEECKNYGLTPVNFYNKSIKARKANPFSENNFLRIPFLEGCKRKGLIV